MRKWVEFLLALAAASMLSAVLSSRFTPRSILAQSIMLAALIGPMYLAPRRYAEWARRCRLPGFRRKA
jgi:hypothetical protein